MYVPLGGGRWRTLNIWPIFLFVALWHDLQPRLVGWALLTCSLFLPELVRVAWDRSLLTSSQPHGQQVVKAVAQQPGVLAWRQQHPWLARQCAGMLATVSIMGLVVVNMVRYAEAVGYEVNRTHVVLAGGVCHGHRRAGTAAPALCKSRRRLVMRCCRCGPALRSTSDV